MGKQSRRHKNHKKSSKPATEAKGSAAPPSKLNIVNKIRHGDVRVRHGALSALSTTTFSPEHLSKNRNISLELVKAIAERILDDDVPISSCALGCIGNYVIFQDPQRLQLNQYQGMEALLTPILLSKMKKTCDYIQNFLQENVSTEEIEIDKSEHLKTIPSSTTSNNNVLIIMEQWSILSLCLHALCGLIESFSTTDASSAILHIQKQEFLSNTMCTLSLATNTIMKIQNANADFEKLLAAKENDSNIISDVIIYAMRTLHSSCDDNPEVVNTMLGAEQEWDIIQSLISNSYIPMLARLHSCGIIIAALQAQPDNGRLFKILASLVIPLLGQCSLYHSDIAQALYTQVNESYIALRKEKDDESIEKDIIRMVDKRKESARSIARRQKEMKTIKSEDATNNEEEINKIAPCEEQIQAEDVYEKSVMAWKNACLPLKLSLEIIANLFTIGSPDNVDDFEDVDGWDVEDDIVEEPSNTQNAMKTSTDTRSKENEELMQQISNSGIADRVLLVFGTVLLEIMNKGSSNSIPKEAMDDLLEVVTNCGLCLCNAFCNLNYWKEKHTECMATWKEFMNFLVSVKDMSNNLEMTSIPMPAIASVMSTMCSILRFRPILVQSVDENDLDLIMAYLSIQTPEDSVTTKADDFIAASDVQKDCVGMLGILCSQPHPDEVNEKICCLLLNVLTRSKSTSVAVLSEILNALMDMYSADEGDPGNHESVFRKKNVIQAFEEVVPILKRKIREKEMKDFTEDDLEYWKETAFNSMRFIKYKKEASS